MAIKNGVRCIDQAIHYANEKQTGEGIKRAIDEGIVTRADLFITSKLWVNHMRKEHAPKCLKRSMDDLGLDYLDLYLVHFPISLKYVPVEEQYPPHWFADMNKQDEGMVEDLVPMSETWGAMESMKDQGLVKDIGVSNMPILMIRDILSYCKHKPAVNQVEMHPFNPQETLVKFCNMNNIKITAYSALGGPSFGEADSCLNNAVVKGVAEAHGKSTAQVLLRWSVQRGIAVIPKSVKEERMKENLNIFDFALTDEQMASITGLDRKQRFNDPLSFTQKYFHGYIPIYQ